jgi:imidazolonepropionase-like amidohydrolase
MRRKTKEIAMNRTILAAIAAGAFAPAIGTPAPAFAAGDEAGLSVYRGAQVWTGDGFEARDLAVLDGRIIDPDAAGTPDEVVDVEDTFITPALADAHNHLTVPADWSSARFLANGTYYVWNPNTVPLGDGAKDYFGRPDTFDVRVANGGITEPRGHPERLYVEVLSERVYNGRKDFLGDAFHYGRDRAEIEASLDTLVDQGADFVKGYLLYSEEYEKRADDDQYYGAKGLDPANVSVLVEEAAARGLKTTFHVETAADLVAAAEGGAFAAMHLPGYGLFRDGNKAVQFILREDQAQRVAESGMVLVATYVLAARSAERIETDLGRSRAALAYAVQRENLSKLRQAGAEFMIGTDGGGSVIDEILHIDRLDVFDRSELLEIAFATGPRLFPGRRIGCLDAGCEADFLVLERNPLEDPAALAQTAMRIKAGVRLEN